ncbi:MAG TPA: ABC transporter substrate-binding protein [Methylomirabilota bacterium]|nr:ABC transporter substrate-binding protein [Methylomirabilota bacterium]
MRTIVTLCVAALLAILSGPGAVTPLEAQTPDVLVIAQGVDMQTGDPHKTTLTHAVNVLTNFYDTLVGRDANLALKPGLALSWRAVDATTWEFKLRQGAKFHNGEPFNAQAVKLSFERMLDPKTKWPGAGALRLIKSVAVVDDSTVRFTTERPWPLLPRYLGYYGMIVPPGLAQSAEDALIRHPVGTGPYKFVRWVKDDRVELEGNPDYWGGKPRINRIVFRAIPSESSRLAELLAGSVHLINIVPPELFKPIQDSGRAKLVEGRSLSVYFVIGNLVNIAREKPLADRRVRQALNHAIDRQAILASIMHNVGKTVSTFCTDVMLGCDASVPGFAYDPERAKALLREAGYPNGFEFSISGTSGAYPGDRDIALAVADQLNKVGVRARANITEYGVQLKAVQARQLADDGWFTRFTDFFGLSHIIPFRAFYSPGEWSLWRPGHKEFDQLVEAANVASDEAQIKDLSRRLQLLYKEEAPAISLFTAPNVYGMHPDLDWTPRPDLLLTMFDAGWRRR